MDVGKYKVQSKELTTGSWQQNKNPTKNEFSIASQKFSLLRPIFCHWKFCEKGELNNGRRKVKSGQKELLNNASEKHARHLL